MYKKVKLNFLTFPCPARLCLNKPNTIFLGSGLKLVLFVALNHPTSWRVQYMICFIYHYIHWFIHHGNTWTHKWPTTNISCFIIKLSWLQRRTGILRSWFNPCSSPEFFRLLYTIAKIAFITARIIIAPLDFISAIQYMVHFIHVYHFIHRIKTVGDLTSNFLVLKKCNGKL